jgi:diguanylate cyclase (GGDEF)-like protein
MEHDTDRDRTVDLETRSSDAEAAGCEHDACLVVISGEPLGARIMPGLEGKVIGRDVASDFRIDQRSVSRRHCRVALEQGCYWIEDLGSTNGTFVNDQPVERVPLRDGDHVRISDTTLKFSAAGNIEASYHSELHENAIRDPLTGLFNRRHATAVLKSQISRASHHPGYRFAMILFDIDYFKQINDRHGHVAGDRVLQQLGELAQSRVRGGDTLARVGGEEFALVLPDTRGREAFQVAEALCQRVADERFDIGGQTVSITLSAGVTEWQATMKGLEDLLKATDAKLYRAKHKGRNCVIGD